MAAERLVRRGEGWVERLVPGGEGWNESIGEHKNRYLFASRYVQGRRVLDAGCGVGYGSRVLADAGASEVVAVDISDEALAIGRQRFSHSRLAFTKDDCQALTEVVGPFEIAVAFESLEHVHDQAAFVRRVSELLSPSGTFIVSTPNKLLLRQKNGRPSNPFHVRELTPDEFEELLAKSFSDVQLMGQRWTAALAGLYRIGHASWSNPMARIGRWLQWVRGHSLSFPLNPSAVPPTEADFVITDTDFSSAPTLVAVCRRPLKQNNGA